MPRDRCRRIRQRPDCQPSTTVTELPGCELRTSGRGWHRVREDGDASSEEARRTRRGPSVLPSDLRLPYVPAVAQKVTVNEQSPFSYELPTGGRPGPPSRISASYFR